MRQSGEWLCFSLVDVFPVRGFSVDDIPPFCSNLDQERIEENSIMGKHVVIIGAGAGGASVAAEARRRDPSLAIVLIEQRGQVSVAA
jgi:shikimate 5-dehydrogenase